MCDGKQERDRLRDIEIAKLDELEEKAWRIAMSIPAAFRGLDDVLKIMAARARLQGLNLDPKEAIQKRRKGP